MVTLGDRSTAIPTVVYVKEDSTTLIGDAASRKGAIDPSRVAREFKRRIGDTVPIILGSSPHSPESLAGKVLRWVVGAVSKQEGEPPSHIAVTHPANWGPYKREALQNVIRTAGLAHVTTLTEPEAAAMFYASSERVAPGAVVAVYDLGGGTFDAAVLRRTDSAFEILGKPDGIEHLGGVDFDQAVFEHVDRALDGQVGELDPTDPASISAVSRLREECVQAKEALSTDTDTSIPVVLPSLQTEIRLTRTEFEKMIKPAIDETIEALRRALRVADVEPEAVSKVLLVGGSSRIPLVAQMVSTELGRPVAVDAHPKHAVAIGAAIAAANAAHPQGAIDSTDASAIPDEPTLSAAALAGGIPLAGESAGELETISTSGSTSLGTTDVLATSDSTTSGSAGQRVKSVQEPPPIAPPRKGLPGGRFTAVAMALALVIALIAAVPWSRKKALCLVGVAQLTQMQPGETLASTSVPTHPPSLAVDTNPNSYWQSAPLDETGQPTDGVNELLRLVFGTASEFDQVGFTIPPGLAHPLQVQVSLFDNAGTRQGRSTFDLKAETDQQTFPLEPSGPATRIVVKVLEVTGATAGETSGAVLSEVAVWADSCSPGESGPVVDTPDESPSSTPSETEDTGETGETTPTTATTTTTTASPSASVTPSVAPATPAASVTP
jgi:actin-like ATPase involved in cell morphogenesis